MDGIVWSHGAGLVGQILSLAAIIYAVMWAYLWLASQIGGYLHRKDVERQFRALLEEDARAWLSREEASYVAQIERDYSIADAITRDDVPFSNDYADQQPHRPQPPTRAA